MVANRNRIDLLLYNVPRFDSYSNYVSYVHFYTANVEFDNTGRSSDAYFSSCHVRAERSRDSSFALTDKRHPYRESACDKFGAWTMLAKTTRFDSAEYLDNDEAIGVYLQEALQSDDPAFITLALNTIARARSNIVNRQGDGAVPRNLSSEHGRQSGVQRR
jgi:hypothetical protein